MRLKYLLITFGLISGLETMAANSNDYYFHGMLWLIIAAIAVIALVISVVNAFRISKIRKVLEANAENTKEDMDLSFRKMKSALYRDVKNIRREINKKKDNNQTAPKKEANTEAIENTDSENKPVKKKPQNRRYYNKKKKPQNTQKNDKPTE